MSGIGPAIGQLGAFTFGTAAQITGAATNLVAHGTQNAGGYTQYWGAKAQERPSLASSINFKLGVAFTGLLQAITGIGQLGTQVLGSTANGFAKMAGGGRS